MLSNAENILLSYSAQWLINIGRGARFLGFGPILSEVQIHNPHRLRFFTTDCPLTFVVGTCCRAPVNSTVTEVDE